MYSKICLHCNNEFDSPYKIRKYCSIKCKAESKQMAYLERWKNGKMPDYKKSGFRNNPLFTINTNQDYGY